MAEKVTEIYRLLSQAPSVLSGRLFGPNNAVVRFSQRNFDAQKVIRFLINYNFDIVSDNVLSDKKNIKKSFPVDVTTEKYVSYSPTGRYVAVIREQTESKETKQILEVWSTDNLKSSVDMKALDVHGHIYTDDDFGSIQWSSQENKLAYIAEKKTPKTEAFYKRKPALKSDNKDDISKGEEYVFKQDWGEQTDGKKESVIAVYDVENDSVTLVTGIQNYLFPAQVVWGPNDSCLVGVAYYMEPRKLGIVYCSNRKSEIFQVDFQGHYRKLSEDGNAVRSPRFSPDFKYLLWLQRKTDKPHHACMRLMKIVFPVNLESCPEVDEVIGLVEQSIYTSNNKIFFGMYNMSFPTRCWLHGGRKLVFSTCHQFQIKSYIVDIESKSLYELDFSDKNANKSHTILDCDDNMIMIKRQHVFNFDNVIIGQVDKSNVSIENWVHLTDDSKVLPGLQNYTYEILTIVQVRKCKSTAPFNVIYVYPKECNKKKSCPLILWPHGGPHGISLNAFRINLGVFASLNMAMLLVNYCGSIGAGQNSINYLLKNVNKCDVEDCMSSLDYCLNKYPDIDPAALFLYGGSYGGFLVAHLSSQFPDRFKAVVAINPVIDIASMALTSDIPDWCFAVSNEQYSSPGRVSDELLLKMRHLSPIQNIEKIKAPTLVLLGTKDLRVPHFQGLYYHYVLKENGVETKVCLYDDNHNLTKFNHEMDSVINSAIWFLEHLSK